MPEIQGPRDMTPLTSQGFPPGSCLQPLLRLLLCLTALHAVPMPSSWQTPLPLPWFYPRTTFQRKLFLPLHMLPHSSTKPTTSFFVPQRAAYIATHFIIMAHLAILQHCIHCWGLRPCLIQNYLCLALWTFFTSKSTLKMIIFMWLKRLLV